MLVNVNDKVIIVCKVRKNIGNVDNTWFSGLPLLFQADIFLQVPIFYVDKFFCNLWLSATILIPELQDSSIGEVDQIFVYNM